MFILNLKSLIRENQSRIPEAHSYEECNGCKSLFRVPVPLAL
jgi:hypothetical protein